MKIRSTDISGVALVDTSPRKDDRGSFTRLFCADELKDVLQGRRVVQINHSYSKLAGTVRGLHYQRPPRAEMKFVQCLKGMAWDVVVDLRKGSPTFLRWHAEELSSERGRIVVVPEGCAHGFQTLQPDTELLYFHTEFFSPEADAGVAATDPRIAIQWPLPFAALSPKDSSLPALTPDFVGISL